MPTLIFPRTLETGAVEPEGTVLPTLIVSIAESGWVLGDTIKSVLGTRPTSVISRSTGTSPTGSARYRPAADGSTSSTASRPARRRCG